VWNSGAQIADYGMLVARTNPDVPKHKGLTVFWLDMKAPGVEIRPDQMMSGDNELNEGVPHRRAPSPTASASARSTAAGRSVISTLMNERAALGRAPASRGATSSSCAARYPRGDGTALDDPAFREWLADYYVQVEALV
jgi:alkylation response protein AidB-like acyl-CoA dehydrogenase